MQAYTIQFFDFESGEVTDVFRREGPFDHGIVGAERSTGPSLAVSPDEEWILYAECPAEKSELMLVENFR
jgi:hypothetical protein